MTSIPSAPVQAASRSFPSGEAAGWRRARRYAVPGWMIERAGERRLAGDWRGACAAAGVEVSFTLDEVAHEHGRDVAAALADDLVHLAPDLVRWHMPRVGRGRAAMTPDQTVVLGGPEGAAGRLYVTSPRWMVQGPQTLRLHFGRVPDEWTFLETDWSYCAFWRNLVHDWSGSRHLWDVRHTAELRERCGGDAVRAPFLDPDGSPRTAGPPAADPGPEDPAGRTEWITALHDRGETVAAFEAAGIDLDLSDFTMPSWARGRKTEPLEAFTTLPLNLARLPQDLPPHGDRFWFPYTQHAAVLAERTASGLCLRLLAEEPGETPDDGVLLPEAVWRRPPDLDLLRAGHITPDELHPLVREALAPARTGASAGPPGPVALSPVRVRCQGEWHETSFRDGTLQIPHTREEQQRESALRAFGGAMAGCFAVRQAWRSGDRKLLPKALREQRDELFARAHHGDTPGVLELLDAGIDPHARDNRGRTLLHKLQYLDHERLLPRLLAAGLDVEATDREERTPLFVAVCEDGDVSLVRALLDAGARIDTYGQIHGEEMSLYRLIDWQARGDLAFLAEMIETRHPEITEEE
ncbi:MAG TPA: ankyrin repeat domain-containing protein [Thermomonospora sp.]|nr:ankyrin repeat domain-containing protein [Thermomonospora sp.]